MALGITLTETARALGYFIVGFVVLLVLGYFWYRLVTYPRLRRRARRNDYVFLGEHAAPGEALIEPWDEDGFRPMRFREWLRFSP
jgi:4-amino-4-deoxy-L-arabinose transferase-like glycosyltransferase